ncbi:hypothetical protein NPA31_008450 [Aurantimonas sp. MSK8Z-1]|uniref:hypothetical protein n=1 Tax=Mangrovibrevibacter kandeliae TaxID=2968473 RepID=UPI00211907E9|nr:hypothetical protein [Aurantimonas sp. MSK8Z-1]MCW4114984.1 hypothetical protein [Aurantimonas sp. MSK8Z-1]
MTSHSIREHNRTAYEKARAALRGDVRPATAVGATALGAAAVGALSLGGLALGAIAVGAFDIGHLRIGHLEIGALTPLGGRKDEMA